MKFLQLVIKILIVILIYYMFYVNHLEIHTHTHTHTHTHIFIFQIILKHVDYVLDRVYITPNLHVANDSCV
jgi:hypothetical protein